MIGLKSVFVRRCGYGSVVGKRKLGALLTQRPQLLYEDRHDTALQHKFQRLDSNRKYLKSVVLGRSQESSAHVTWNQSA